MCEQLAQKMVCCTITFSNTQPSLSQVSKYTVLHKDYNNMIASYSTLQHYTPFQILTNFAIKNPIVSES